MSTDLNPHAVPDAEPASDFAAFAPVPRAVAAPGRRRLALAFVVAGLAVAGAMVAYQVYSSPRVDPDAPRVTVEVTGMHCPIQCGLRVTAALEELPFVVRGSVTASPQTQTVVFAATDATEVDAERTRTAIERAGFGVRTVGPPVAPK